MKLHGNARTCPNSRRLLVNRVNDQSWSVTAAAAAAGISERTAYRWLARWREEGIEGLRDRSSAPKRIPHRTPCDRVQAIAALRRLHMTAAEIAEVLAMALSTVSAVLKRIGLGKRSGELIHLDIKKLGRISARGAGHRVSGNRSSQFKVGPRRLGATGWEFVHVAVDDATRLAYVEVLSDERGATAAGFVRRTTAWFASFAITVERVLSDNGACYRSKAHALALADLGIRQLFPRPYRPRTNGKAEPFIQTLPRRWAYGAIYGSSAERAAALPGWLNHYNFRRPHGSLSHKPPGVRLRELTNVAGNYR